jgi:hypothetical protein
VVQHRVADGPAVNVLAHGVDHTCKRTSLRGTFIDNTTIRFRHDTATRRREERGRGRVCHPTRRDRRRERWSCRATCSSTVPPAARGAETSVKYGTEIKGVLPWHPRGSGNRRIRAHVPERCYVFSLREGECGASDTRREGQVQESGFCERKKRLKRRGGGGGGVVVREDCHSTVQRRLHGTGGRVEAAGVHERRVGGGGRLTRRGLCLGHEVDEHGVQARLAA